MNAGKTASAKQQEWLDHLELARTSGLSLTDYARQLDLNVNTLYHWKHVLVRQGLWQETQDRLSTMSTACEDQNIAANETGTAAVFVPVQVAPTMSGLGRAELMARLPNGVELHFGKLGVERLPVVMQALATLPCSP